MTRDTRLRQRVTAWTELNGVPMRLGGVIEVAIDLDVEPTRITTWINRQRKNSHAAVPPEPLFRLAMGPVYDIDEWRLWFGLKPEDAPLPEMLTDVI